jgi:hypothetical protein
MELTLRMTQLPLIGDPDLIPPTYPNETYDRVRKGMMHPKVAQLLARPRWQFGLKHTFEKRQRMITATNVSTIVHKLKIRGKNPYRSMAKLLRQKFKQEPFRPSSACDHGVKYEPELLRAYEHVTGNILYDGHIGFISGDSLPPQDDYIMPEYIGATPDGICRDKPILVEGKCPFLNQMLEGRDIDELYYPQVQTQLAVCGMKLCHFVRYVPDSIRAEAQLDIIEIAFDPEWWEAARPAMAAFYQRLLMPAPQPILKKLKRVPKAQKGAPICTL